MSLFDGRFKTCRLEDGEEVVRLRGVSRGERKSSQAHAGLWGKDTAYVLVPCPSQRSATTRSNLAISGYPGLYNRSGDLEVLLLGPLDVIERLITKGPDWCRARVSLKGKPRSAAQESATAAALEKLRGPR